MSATTERLLVPYEEARHKLGSVGRTKFHELINEQKIIRVRVGRRSFITADSIRQYVDSLTQLALFDEPEPAERKLVEAPGWPDLPA